MACASFLGEKCLKMKVHYNYLPQEFSDTNEIFEKWGSLIQTTDFTLGAFVEEFESKFSKYMGARHCISTNCGTDALILSLRALGIGEGDEVITVANTFYATVGAIVACGATPVIVDCDERFQVSVEEISKAISENTKAILPVHWAGASPDIVNVVDLAREKGLYVIEDACMAIGGFVDGGRPGLFGDVGAFSMHPLKSLNVMGDGGMVLTDNDVIADWMRKYRNHGMVDRDHIEFWGVNMRLQPLQAIVAGYRLDFLAETVEKRNDNAKILDSGLVPLKEFVTVPQRIPNYYETFSLYMALFEQRDRLVSFLQGKGIEVKIHYPVPLHRQKAARRNCIVQGVMHNADYQANHLMTIPVHQYLNDNHMEYVIACVNDFYK